EAIAQRNDWTEQQLADRSVPTAGFDETSTITLEYGERTFEIKLNSDLMPVLYNMDGKAIKNLPEPRQADDPESIKSAKLQFIGCKKEIKQVVDQQSRRLHEAMCIGRIWQASEWRQFVLCHPLLGRLAQQLIWQEIGKNGIGQQLFRPSVDKVLIDIHDNEVPLQDDANLRLAHGTQMHAQEIDEWLTHMWDYKVKPLFPQISQALPNFDAKSGALHISDREGWLADAYRLSSVFEKRGYIRGTAGEGGMIREYLKNYDGVNIAVEIGFTGVFVQGGNNTAALTRMNFQRTHRGDRETQYIPLDQVPKVLLAESYADYLAVAGACDGFDPDWESKVL
ncbi:MAG TPA: DUF4132 domain-containing protein, partial [Burkholderiaceae bacterium]|nr:DUF4132 domain-containing protein [Burkholderiaceae bacterium]